MMPSSSPALAKLTQAEVLLSEAASVDEITAILDIAEAARVYARQLDLGTRSINHATKIKLKAERRLADIVDEGQASGQIASRERKPGRPTKDAESPSDPEPLLTLTDLGVSSARLSEARKIRDKFTEDDIERVIAQADAEGKEVARSKLLNAARFSDKDNEGKHPAKFSEPLFEIMDAMLPQSGRVLDPFAGVGGVHRLATDERVTVGVEIEPEWASQHPDTMVGDALSLPFEDHSFDAICTSPTYGNRMADTTSDGTYRYNYRVGLGRMPSEGSSSAMQWGDSYRVFHERAWAEALRVLRPGGSFVLNIKDHIRGKERQPVTAFHVGTLIQLGMKLVDLDAVPVSDFKKGVNAGSRVGYEYVILLRKS